MFLTRLYNFSTECHLQSNCMVGLNKALSCKVGLWKEKKTWNG